MEVFPAAGEETRIIPVKDVVNPEYMSAAVFCPIYERVTIVGRGALCPERSCLGHHRKIVDPQGIIDMSGLEPNTRPQTLNVVVSGSVPIEQHEHEAVAGEAGFRAAYLGKAGRAEPTRSVYETKPIWSKAKNTRLAKVVYVYMLQTQGLLHDTYVYGVDAKKIIPTFIYPTEVMDGAIVSGNCVSACDKNPTYIHQNNPVIHDLYEHHGKDLNFLGCVITNENVTLADKERSSNMAAKLVEFLGADAAIISEEGFGNPDTDLVMNCYKLEKKGIKTVLITDEYAGQDGASQSLADSTPLGNAVVTAGNANELITLPPMKRVIGYPEVADVIAGGTEGSLKPDGSITAEIQVITGSTNELGFASSRLEAIKINAIYNTIE